MKRYLRFLRVKLRAIGLTSWVQVGIVSVFLIMAVILAVHSYSLRSRPPFTAISEPTYARAILEEKLVYSNNADYDRYMQNYYPQVTKQMFLDGIYFAEDAYGYYVPASIQFSDASFQYNNVSHLGYTVVDYEAKFTKSPARTVLVEIAFVEINGKRYIESIGLGATGTFGQ